MYINEFCKVKSSFQFTMVKMEFVEIKALQLQSRTQCLQKTKPMSSYQQAHHYLERPLWILNPQNV